jgi:hypothetical protein
MNLWFGILLNPKRVRTIFASNSNFQSCYLQKCAEDMQRLLGINTNFLYSFINPATALIMEHWKLEEIKRELGSYTFVDEERKKQITSSEFQKNNHMAHFENLGISYNLIFRSINNDQKLIEEIAFEKFKIKKSEIFKSYQSLL